MVETVGSSPTAASARRLQRQRMRGIEVKIIGRNGGKWGPRRQALARNGTRLGKRERAAEHALAAGFPAAFILQVVNGV